MRWWLREASIFVLGLMLSWGIIIGALELMGVVAHGA